MEQVGSFGLAVSVSRWGPAPSTMSIIFNEYHRMSLKFGPFACIIIRWPRDVVSKAVSLMQSQFHISTYSLVVNSVPLPPLYVIPRGACFSVQSTSETRMTWRPRRYKRAQKKDKHLSCYHCFCSIDLICKNCLTF